ncbi:MAG: kelch repeat-containing protein, partial [Elusimicrobiota bacterium]
MDFRKVFPLLLLALALLTPGAGALNSRRHSHTATLLPDGNIFIAGGIFNTAAVAYAGEMYDMASNTYVAWGDLQTARSSHTATLMSDGRVLIAGGFGAGGQPLLKADALEICDPITKTCAKASVDILTVRGGHTATLLSKGPMAGRVLLCGGRTGTTGTEVTEKCETFNPTGPLVLAAGAMVSPRE